MTPYLPKRYIDLDDVQARGKGVDAHIDWRTQQKRLERHLDKYWEAHRKDQVVSPRKKSDEELDVDEILDEIDEEEIEDADELDEDDDPTEEKPRRKSSRAKARSSKKKSSKKKAAKEGIGTAEVAEAAGVDPRSLRVLLRAEFPREEGGRYQWSSLNHPEVKKIIRRVKEGGAKQAKQESLDKLKKSKGKSKKGKESAAEAKKRRAAARRKKAREEAEDDE